MYILPFLLASYCAEWVVYAWTVNYLFCPYREEFTSKSNQYVLGRVAKEVKSLQPETLSSLIKGMSRVFMLINNYVYFPILFVIPAIISYYNVM